MAALNILSPPLNPLQLTTDSTSLSICKYNININAICQKYASVSNSICKCGRTLATAKSKLSFMPSQMFPQRQHLSGSGCSWMQDDLAFYNNVVANGRTRGPLHSVFPSTNAPVSSVKDLFDFICAGPLISKTNLTPEKVSESIDKWILYGSQLCRLFQLNELFLTEPQKVRIYHYYIPVFLWCEQEISRHNSMFQEGDDIPPLVIGFSAPQGCGKTTLVFALNFLFRMTGRNSATISIDDFYLTAQDQAKLRDSNPGNALLEFRGNAGSHDLALSIETLTALGKLTKEGMKIKLPRYDKSAYNGRGDRADPSTWPEVEGPLKAEIAMRADGKPGMSDEEVMDFVSRYLPAYKAYLPTLYSEGPNDSNPEHLLVVEIDEGRNPILAN